MMKMVAFFRKTRMTNKKEQRIEAVALRCEGGKKKRESEVDEMRRSAPNTDGKKKNTTKKKKPLLTVENCGRVGLAIENTQTQ